MREIIKFIGFFSIFGLVAFGCNGNAQIGSDNSENNQYGLNWKKVLEYSDKGSPKPDQRIEKSEAEWRELLSPEQFQVTRKSGTERAFTGKHYNNYELGIYACTCCGTELFRSEQKFKSGTGWPSFIAPLKDNVIKYLSDNAYSMRIVEVECNVCDAHLGHVFNDGPNPTGLRYCINSVSLDKISGEKTEEINH